MMLFEYIGYFFIFIAGTFIGSFLNVVADRLQTGESILFDRSHCEECKTSLATKDLVPLLSFLLLRGKCRYCRSKLPYYYPFSEILTGLAYFSIAFYMQLFKNPMVMTWVIYSYLVFVVSVYIIIFLSDLKYKIIPDKVVLPAIVVVFLFIVVNIAYSLIVSYNSLKNDDFGKYLLEAGLWHNQVYLILKQLGFLVLSSFGISMFFLLLIIVTRGRGMGGGDVKLGFLIGLFNGFPLNIVAIFLGFLFGSIFGLLLILAGRKGLKDTIAFGPYLILGSAVTFVYGSQLYSWYINLLK